MELKKDKTIKTFDQVLIAYKPGTQRGFSRMFLNFEKFCKENYKGNMEEMVRKLLKTDEATVYSTLQEWINFNSKFSPNTVKVFYSYLKKYLTHRGIDLTKSKDSLIFQRMIEEEKYPVSLDDLQKIINVAGFEMKLKIMVQVSSGMRRGEMMQLRKKDFILGKRIMIKIPATFAKFNKARTTFVSSEVSSLLIPILNKLNDNDIVLGSGNTKDENIGDSYEQNLVRYLHKTGLDMRYESTKYHKINTHSFRAYFITRVSRHDPNIAKKLAGQRVYMGQYDRLSADELLEKYIEFEPDLFIYKQKPKSDEIQELAKKVEEKDAKLEELSQKLEEYQKRDLSDKDADKIIEQMRKNRPQWTKAIESAYEEVHKKTRIVLNEEMKRQFGMTDKEFEEYQVWKRGMLKKIKGKESC